MVGTRVDREAAPAGADDDAAAATTAIAGLRWRLSQQGTLEHPAVRHELRMLDEQLAAQLERDGRIPGRHRSPAGHLPSRNGSALAEDADENPVRPAPVTARGAAELIAKVGH